MGDENKVVVTCPFCARKIHVPPQWWDKFMQITCRNCKGIWREVIPKPKEQREETSTLEDMIQGAKDFLSDSLPGNVSDFLFGSNANGKKGRKN